MPVIENKVNTCNRFGCFVCPQLRVGNSYRFNCGFVFEVPENEQLSCDSKDVIYVLTCKTCHGEYIGETQCLKKRLCTHSSHIRTNQHFCRATDHLIECGYHITDVRQRFSVFLLETEHDKDVRKAKESFYIRLFKPLMNK